MDDDQNSEAPNNVPTTRTRSTTSISTHNNKHTNNAIDMNDDDHVLRDLTAGMLSGLLSALLLQPIDKALYISIKFHRPYFDVRNWRKPYHAMSQSLFYRALSHALYFPTEQWTRNYINKGDNHTNHQHNNVNGVSFAFANACGGMFAGGVTATALNPIAVVRMYCWITHGSFFTEVKNLWIGRGIRNFGRGLTATIYRDVTFGAVFSAMRHWNAFGWLNDNDHDHLRHTTQLSLDGDDDDDDDYDGHYDYDYKKHFVWNGFSALIATTFSSPFNYVRSIQFAEHHNHKPLSLLQLFKQLKHGFSECTTPKSRFDYLQLRFKFGWATARVALGMAIGSQTYEFFVRTMPM